MDDREPISGRLRPMAVTSTRAGRVLGATAALGGVLLAACSTAATTTARPGTPAPRGPASPPARTVTVHGVSVTVPPGWSASEGPRPLCGGPPAAHSVSAYTGAPRVAACPAILVAQKPVEAVQLTEIYGAWGSQGWFGTRTTWRGQPAWITRQPSGGVPASPRLLTTTIALPWLDAIVAVTGATAARTEELLGYVTLHVEPELTVPASATAMSVVAADLGRQPTTTTGRPLIDGTLTALRGLPPFPVRARCGTTAVPGSVYGTLVVTFTGDGGRTTSFLVAPQTCGQVTSGTGAAGRADTALYAALSGATQAGVG